MECCYCMVLMGELGLMMALDGLVPARTLPYRGTETVDILILYI